MGHTIPLAANICDSVKKAQAIAIFYRLLLLNYFWGSGRECRLSQKGTFTSSQLTELFKTDWQLFIYRG